MCRLRDDSGSAVAEFALVSALLTLVFASVLQVGLAMHVRNTVIDSALAGARMAGLPDRSEAEAAERTAGLITTAIGAAYAKDVRVSTHAEHVTVTVHTPVPVLGLAGPRTWVLRASSLREDTDAP